MPRPRAKAIRKLPRKMHIYCEGAKTEPNYITGYIGTLEDRALRNVICIEKTRKNTPVELVDVAISQKRNNSTPKGDVFWVVYDRESITKYDDKLHDQAYKRAKDNDINIALTNVCFEQWILLHFIDSSTAYSCFDDLITNSNLKRLIKDTIGQDYHKASLDIFNHLKPNIAQARQRAIRINERALASAQTGRTKPHHLNPYTDMPTLLDAIDEFT
ncbi:hypothetical protein CS390_10880 [Pseudomonas sp. HLS-6]|uniref:RloB family protein n=1 Tax=Pseudomonas sp. HLS-6 TaxID=2049589 RepID=UPI000C197801|nr:RloB family protein [Pseudomonas sp. HLS-6]ATR83017.1 hypothetical protein CS390_10880 [Pseudomonas sp. HLS-6]